MKRWHLFFGFSLSSVFVLYIIGFMTYRDTQSPNFDGGPLGGLALLMVVLYIIYYAIVLLICLTRFISKAKNNAVLQQQIVNPKRLKIVALAFTLIVASSYIFFALNNPYQGLYESHRGQTPKILSVTQTKTINIPAQQFFALLAHIETLANAAQAHASLNTGPCFNDYVATDFIRVNKAPCILFYATWGTPAKQFLSVEHSKTEYDWDKKQRMIQLQINFAALNSETLQRISHGFPDQFYQR